MTSIEDELYGGGGPFFFQEAVPRFPSRGPQSAANVERFWRPRVRPLWESACVLRRPPSPLARFESNDFHTCVLRPVSDALISRILVQGDGTYEWTPLPEKGVRFPYLEIQLGEYLTPEQRRPDVFGRSPKDLSAFSISDINPAVAFLLVQTATQYTLTQGDKSWSLSRTTTDTCDRVCQAPLTVSFVDVSWTVRLTNASTDE
jgi:hypothetical protein